MKDYKNILVIKPSALGDIILSLATLNTLKASFPSARITWMVRPEFAAVFDGSPRPDDVLLFDRKKLGSWWKNQQAFQQLVQLFKRLKKDDYDLVIDLQGLFRTALFSVLTFCRDRYGMDVSREFSRFFYSTAVKQGDEPLHLIDYYNRVAAAAGAGQVTHKASLNPHPQAIEQADELLRSHELEAGSFAVLITGAAQDYKLWPIESFAEIARGINYNYGMKIAAVGTQAEQQRIKQLAVKSDVPIVDLSGKTSIQQLIAVLQKAALVVTGDTGPGHIASVSNIPTVFIFGPTNPARVGPYHKPQAVAAIDPFSRGIEIESDLPEHRIENVTVDMVFEAITQVL